MQPLLEENSILARFMTVLNREEWFIRRTLIVSLFWGLSKNPKGDSYSICIRGLSMSQGPIK